MIGAERPEETRKREHRVRDRAPVSVWSDDATLRRIDPGVLRGGHLVIRDGVWVAQMPMSHDRRIKQKSNTRFLDCVKNVYRVLLTRGLRGCFVTFLDEETRLYVEGRLG